MERMNGEVRDREKVMRGLKKSDTPILAGYQIYHNYIRPHEALQGKTPLRTNIQHYQMSSSLEAIKIKFSDTGTSHHYLFF
jgi:hypothetical protein